MEALIVLVALAIPIAAIASFFMALGARNRLSLVESRLNALEARLARAPGAAHVASIWTGPEGPAVPPAPEAEKPPSPEPERPLPASAATPEVAPQSPSTPKAEPVTAPVAVVPPIPPAPQPAQPERSFEERFGTQWVVWVGGVALALGGIFLVRYSIEQGWIGPGVRLFLGALLAAALIGAGEWARRNEIRTGFAEIPTAHIPGILTASGTTVAYATVYAAYALYGFLGPGAAFLLLGIVALATLAAALLHGPALAGLGLVGAYVTPFVVASEEPSFWALYLYLAVVTAAAFALARLRLWRWLAITAVLSSACWILPGLPDAAAHSTAPHVFYAIVAFALAAALIVSGLGFGPDAVPDTIDGVSSMALIAFLIAAALVVMASGHDMLALFGFAGLVAATVAIAWRAPSSTAAVPAAAVLAALVLAEWAVDTRFETLIAPAGPTAGAVPEPLQAHFGLHLLLGGAFAALFGGVGFLAQGRSERPEIPLVWAASAVVAPIAILIALYYRIYGFERSIPFAGIALLLAALYAFATELTTRRPPRPGLASASALFAVGTVAALALTLTLALEKGWLTVALALMVPGIAYIAAHRPLPLLRWLSAAIAVLVLLRIGWEPRIVGNDVGTTPIFNWLLYGYGVPALSFWLAGYLLRQRADDVPSRTIDSLAILFTVLLAGLEIRHYVNSGDVYRPASGLNEVALQVSIGLAMAIGLERLRGRTNNIVHDAAALLVAALTLCAVVFGLALSQNPLFTGEPVGGRLFNLILLGYGLPAVLAIILALTARTTRPMPYRAVAVVTAVALSILYLSLEIRRLYHGPVLTAGPTTDAEQYTYSAAWLAYGVVLLLAGILLRSQPARLASAAVVILTIAKVFFYDMAGLTGIFRALSFIGLGLVLVGIGYLYQRLLFPRRPLASVAVASSS
ncbi:MAG: DUF2339 domain-containing protein [Xanthobacteraceae bacterium]